MHSAIKHRKVRHFAEDTNLMNFQASINAIQKQNKTLCRHKTLKTIYYAIFESIYASLVWAQNSSPVKRLHVLLKKSLQLIMFFQNANAHTGPLFKTQKFQHLGTKLHLRTVY